MRDHVVNVLCALLIFESCALALAVACAIIALTLLAVKDRDTYRAVAPGWVQRLNSRFGDA